MQKTKKVFVIVFLLVAASCLNAQAERTSVKKLCSAYQPMVEQPEIQEFIAEHFDMVFIGRTLNKSAYNIKVLNPDIRLVCFYNILAMQDYYPDWNEVNQHDEWFMHDIYIVIDLKTQCTDGMG